MATYFRPNPVRLLTTVLLFSNFLLDPRDDFRFVTLALAAGDEVDSSSNAELKDDILSIVEKRHPSHGDAALIKNFGNKAIPVLIDIFNTTTSNVTKTRVIEVLSHFEDDRVRTFIEQELKTNSNHSLKGTVLENIAFSYGFPANVSKANEDAVLNIIEPYLDSENPDVRLSAARGLGTIPTERSLRRLENFVLKESQKSVHDHANRVLQKLRLQLKGRPETSAQSSVKANILESKFLVTKEELQSIVGSYEGLFVGGLFLRPEEDPSTSTKNSNLATNKSSSAKPYFTPNMTGYIKLDPEKSNSLPNKALGSSTGSIASPSANLTFSAHFSIDPKPLPKSDIDCVIAFDPSNGTGKSVLKLPEIYLADKKLSHSMSRILPKSPSFVPAAKIPPTQATALEIPIKVLAWSKKIDMKTQVHLEFRNQNDETLFSFRQVKSN